MFAFVAVMDAEQKIVDHIEGLLRSARIRCSSNGNAISELFVERTHVELAIHLLQAERAAGWPVSVVPVIL